MALLAQPKRKTKYGLDPRNTNWSNDDNKFGQKLMEKMGWEKGKGLGANENGMTEHIKASYKSDTRGLGCTPQDADAWIAHQDDFNELLKNLNSQTGTDKQEDKAESEKKTQDGQKRYYGRFARGRVQTLRSTEDLDCIFGRRTRKTSEPSTPQANSAGNSDSEGDKTEENRHGLTTVTSSSSVQEYFAKKMAEMKARREAGSGKNSPSNLLESENIESNEVKVTKGQEKRQEERVPPVYGAVSFSYNENKPEDENSNDVTGLGQSRGWYQDWNEGCQEGRKEKSRKKKKKGDADVESVPTGPGHVSEKEVVFEREENLDVICETDQDVKKKRKKKKKKRDVMEKEECVNNDVDKSEEVKSDVDSERKKKKKSKKRKRDVEDENEKKRLENDEEIVEVNEDEQRKSKKRKVEKTMKGEEHDRSCSGEDKPEIFASQVGIGQVDKKKKSKDKKNEEDKIDYTIEVSLESGDKTLKKKRKKERREKEEEIAEEKLLTTEGEKVKKEKKKKKMKRMEESEGGERSDEEREEGTTPADSQTSGKKDKHGQTKMTRRERVQRKKERKMKEKEEHRLMNDWFPGSNIGEIEGYQGLDTSKLQEDKIQMSDKTVDSQGRKTKKH